jgi:membrane protease subunit HflK
LYLPLDRLLNPSVGSNAAGPATSSLPETLPATSSTTIDGSAAATRLRDLNRGREVR